jgi:hypothetical protein
MIVLIPTEPLARVVINPLRAEWLVAPCIGLTIDRFDELAEGIG